MTALTASFHSLSTFPIGTAQEARAPGPSSCPPIDAAEGALHERSDEALLSAYCRGNAAAFETLFERYRHGALFNFLLRRVRNRECAEELYQDVWVKVIKHCDEFRGDSKFSTWLYSIARHRCIDHARRMKFRSHKSLDAHRRVTGEPLVAGVADSRPCAERLAFSVTIRRRIASAVENLPDEQQEVFLMRQLEGLTFSEIAEVVRAPVNTVKSRMRYALERLHWELDDLRDRE